MIVNPHVPLHRLVLSLSEALDHVHARVANHQQRTAYIATCIARQMGYGIKELVDVFHAAALHDIGLISPKNRVLAVHLGQLEEVSWHAEVGYQLLKRNALFERSAPIIRNHHIEWDNGRGAECGGSEIPLSCHVVSLADTVELAIDRGAPILGQANYIIEKIRSKSGTHFHPECVDAFCEVARRDAFWLDLCSPRIYAVLLKSVDWPVLQIDEVTLQQIAEVFARVVDAASPWTAVHSAGVAATAVALAQRMRFSPRELHMMRAAGYLHDLGKLVVPAAILDKPAKLTDEEYACVKTHTYHTFHILDTIGGMPQIAEWAAFHHERLDGSGYPFRHAAEDLTLGSRIMAVADVFTAITEERPYRKDMSRETSMQLLNDSAASGALDGEVVATLEHAYEEIFEQRRTEQIEYGAGQKQLRHLIDQWETAQEAELALSHV